MDIKEAISKKYVKILLIYFVLAVAAIIVTFTFFEELSSIAAVFVFTTIGLGIIFLFDTVVLKSLDTIEEIKKGNLAYAIFFLGICVIIAAAIISA